MNEQQRAEMEADLIEKSDSYFNARPQLDTGHNIKIFESGFERGYRAAIPTKQPDKVEPLYCGKRTTSG